ncbi:MAG: hypothetical protein AAF674_16500 [Pseudomonadota bacterium]
MSVFRSNLVHGLGGLILMGSWAAYANSAHPWPVPAIAFAVQGALTAVITLILKRTVETVVARQPSRPWLAPLAAAGISASLLSLVHLAVGTPAYWATLAVPFTVAAGYASFYTWRLVRDG